MTVLAVSLAAAAAFALASVLQQQGGVEGDIGSGLSAIVLARLVRRPLWLIGVATLLGGYVAEAVALGTGNVVEVEPLLATSLVFTLPLASAWAHQRMSARDWLATVATTGGIAAFLVVGNPTGGASTASSARWILAGASVFVCCAPLVVLGARTHGGPRALLLGVAAGITNGLADVVTKSTVALLGVSVVRVAESWEPWTLGALAILGLLLSQGAYQATHLAASVPAMTIAEPVVGAILGVFLFGEQISQGGPAPVIEAVSAVIIVAGVIALARSPLVTGQVSQEAPTATGDEVP